ncbi:MAG: hypothetical protein JWO56_182 [Acidobacteria bacterium]|nr:hypothetical protein [Acidobacteriota bacterium]
MTRLHLVVEGPDDKHVIGHLLQSRGITLRKEPTVADGISPLLAKLETYLKLSYDAHAVVVDADIDVRARWDALRHRLMESGYENVPLNPAPEGLIVTAAGKPPAGVWIMPDNALPGTLEDFVHQLVPEGDLLWVRARRVVEEIPVGERRFSSTAKAEIHTWLAWQEEPGTAMGSAITKRYFATDSQLADRFVLWIERLIAVSAS